MPACRNKTKGNWYASFTYETGQGKKEKRVKQGLSHQRRALEWEQDVPATTDR